jgi:NAD(P)-dependent dehydrogenase (short-subunit alcohol dehydrogenase family)
MQHPGPRLAGKVAIVTGSGGGEPAAEVIGIGAAIARLLALAGASVMVVDRDQAAGARTVAAIRTDGGTAGLSVRDLATPAGCAASVADTIAAFGRVDILVNNAALLSTMQADAMTEEEWNRVIATNLTAAMFMSKHTLADMMPRGEGAIVNIVSSSGQRSFANSAYAASKAGLMGLTVDMAGNYGRHGIRVNAVMPGTIWAPMAQHSDTSPLGRARRIRSNPIETEGTGWDIAWTVLFLAGEEARWITGVTIPVDAGLMIAAPLPTYLKMRAALD